MNGFMLCISKEDNEVYRIYDIVYPKAGYPNFLYYDGQQWRLRSAKFFVPLDEIELIGDDEFDDEDFNGEFFDDNEEDGGSTFSYDGFNGMS